MREALVPAAVLAAVLLAGCSASTEAAAPAQSESPTQATATEGAVDDAAGTDLTAQVQEAVGADLAPLVTKATQTEPGRVQVDTSITDPRTDNSSEASQAIDICAAASGMDGITYVSVMESDGSTFALFGHPTYPAGECSEA